MILECPESGRTFELNLDFVLLHCIPLSHLVCTMTEHVWAAQNKL